MSDSIKPQEMSDQQFLAFMIMFGLGLGGFVIYRNMDLIHYWYFRNFIPIWLTVYFLVSGLIFGLSYWFLRKPIMEAKKRIDSLKNYTRAHAYSDVFVGKTADGLPIYVSEKARLSHVQIIGTTGGGKTESVIMPWTQRDLKKGASVIIIDGKGSPEIEEKLQSFSEKVRPIEVKCFDLNNLENSLKINPLLHGTAEEICDRLFEALEFEESEYYKNVQYAGCLLITEVLKASGETVSFKSIHELLSVDESLRALALKLNDDRLKVRVRDFLSTAQAKRKEQFSGLLAQITPFATGALSGILNAKKSECSITKLLTESANDEDRPQALIFSLPTLKYQKQASRIGKLLLQELAWTVSVREAKGKKDFTPVFLDEFSSFVYPGFINILNKARSSGVAFHLSHQSLGDLQKVSRDFATSLNTNTNVKCIFSLNDPDTVDFFARHIGTKESTKLTKRVRESSSFMTDLEDTGEASMREVESYKITPNSMKELNTGQGVLHIAGGEGLGISEVLDYRMFRHDEVREDIDGFNIFEVIFGC